MKALELTAYGNPKDVIRLVDQPEFGPLAATSETPVRR